MYPHGTIYHIYINQKSGSHGETYLQASKLVRIAYGFIRGIGAGLVATVIVSLILSFGPILKNEINYSIENTKTKTTDKNGFGSLLDQVAANNLKRVQEEANSYKVNSYFSIVIPKINAAANITANVDASNEEEYRKALMAGVAHAKGTYFPGQGKTIFLFAHSTNAPWNVSRYNAIFYLLGKLEAGDKFIIFFADHKYEYEVKDKLIAKANDTSWLVSSEASEKVILQTCDPPGTSLRRLLVIAEPLEERK
jgi:sortase A